jgi:RNA polymerase sigma factor (sigma-70 family)
MESTEEHPEAPHVVDLAPDPSILSAIGAGHSLATAMADLIDNSIDKGATKFLARFITRNEELIGIRMHDDGAGMSATQLAAAMRLGVRREYGAAEHGHFGVGLKAASFSQADRLTVYSRCGYEPTRAIRLARARFEGEVLSNAEAQHGFTKGAGGFARVESGTVVEWDHLHSVFTGEVEVDRRRWLDEVFTSLGHDLGLTFHRILSRGDITIVLQQFDTRTGDGIPVKVTPVDPFDFTSGAAGYPLNLVGTTPGGAELRFTCHIMQPANQGPSARLLGRPRAEWQGLYVYRNDRLQQAGGWLNLLPGNMVELQLARIAINVTVGATGAVRINPEKHGVVLTADGVHAIERAVTEDGRGLRSFLSAAREVFRLGTRRERGPKPVARIAEGLPQAVIGAMDEEFGFRDDGNNLRVLWKPLGPGRLFELEHAAATVWLNEGYREQLQGVHGGDAAFFKTSIVLQLQDKLERLHLQQSTIDQIERIHTVLAAATFQQIDEHTYDARRETATRAARPVADDELDIDGWQVGDEVPIPVRVDEDGLSIEAPTPEFTERGRGVRRPTDAVKDYLSEIARAPLLSAADEVELARRIEAGLLAEERLASDSAQGQRRSLLRELREIASAGQHAKARFINANLRLVVSVAKRYAARDMELLDLIQEGNAGLIHAVEKFDYVQGTKFSTYATWWIRQGISRALDDKARLIRLPVHMMESLRRLSSARAALAPFYPDGVPLDDLARHAEIEVSDIQRLDAADRLTHVWSLDAPWYNPESRIDEPYGEHLVDDGADATGEAIDELLFRQDLVRLLRTLDSREARVVVLRFGLDGGEPHTLDAIGFELGVTRERIRQLEKKALERMRGPRAQAMLAGHRCVDGTSVREDRPINSVRTGRPLTVEEQIRQYGRKTRRTRRAAQLTIANSSAANRSTERQTNPIATTLDTVKAFLSGQHPDDIARHLNVDRGAVLASLSQRLFGVQPSTRTSDRPARHGAGYSYADAELIDSSLSTGASIHDLALRLERTPYGVACRILLEPRYADAVRRRQPSAEDMGLEMDPGSAGAPAAPV